MVDLSYYTPPRLREPLRQAAGLGYSLLDNIIGLDDGYQSAGERFGTQLRQDPIGVGRAIGSGIFDSVIGAVKDPVGAVKGVATGIADSYGNASQGAAAYLPEGVALKDASMDQIRAANDAYLADVANLASVVPATRAVGGTGRAAMRLGRAVNKAYGADIIGAGRAIATGNTDLLSEVFQRGREGQSVGAAKVGSDYFIPPMKNAGRAKDPAMNTEWSETKHKTAPYSWETAGRYLGETTAPTLITPSKDQGKRLFFLTGDRTAGDAEIMGLTNLKFRRPVRLYAGGDYMDTGDVWASHRGVMVPKQNVWEKMDPDSLKAGYMPMGERSGDFAKHQGELLSEALYSSPLPTKVVKVIDDEMKKIVMSVRDKAYKKDLEDAVKANKKRKEKGLELLDLPQKDLSAIPSVASEEFRDWLKGQSAEKIQKPFIAKMDTSPMKALEGVPDVGEVRFAATSPELVNAPSYSGGYRMGTPDVRRGLLESSHESYDTKTAAKEGTRAETFGTHIPSYIFARDVALPRIIQNIKSGGFNPLANDYVLKDYLLPKDQRSLTMNPKLNQLMDQQWVDENSRFIELEKTLGRPYAEEYARGLLLDALREL